MSKVDYTKSHSKQISKKKQQVLYKCVIYIFTLDTTETTNTNRQNCMQKAERTETTKI